MDEPTAAWTHAVSWKFFFERFAEPRWARMALLDLNNRVFYRAQGGPHRCARRRGWWKKDRMRSLMALGGATQVCSKFRRKLPLIR